MAGNDGIVCIANVSLKCETITKKTTQSCMTEHELETKKRCSIRCNGE